MTGPITARQKDTSVKITSRKLMSLLSTTTFAAAGLLAMSSHPARALDEMATPTGEQVVGGSASFDRPDIGQLNIQQNTNRVVINWDSFNIGTKGKTEFFQPGSGSLAVNRVTGNHADPTQILGTLKANGRIMVLDRNGVFFGKDSVINVGGIIASTGDVDTDAVMRGDSRLELGNFGNGAITNLGTISVADAGLAAFVAPQITNSGIINARLGRVAFGSGSKVTLDLYGDNLLEIALDSKHEKALINQLGTINAEGGTVLITAQAAKEAVDNVINMAGVVNVASFEVQGGKIVLNGGGKGTVNVTGTLNASGEGGGSIKINGENVLVSDLAALIADGGNNGDGGDIYVLADNTAIFEGRARARGGLFGGNGGFIETSGLHLGVSDTASVDASAANGLGGLWLLDPLSIIIASGAGSTISLGGFTYTKVNADTISTALSAGTSVTVETGAAPPYGSSDTAGATDQNEGDILVRSNITHTGNTTGAVLTLTADDDIIIENGADIQHTSGNGRFGIVMNAQGSGSLIGNIIIRNGSVIGTNGGNATFNAEDTLTVEDGGQVNTNRPSSSSDGTIYIQANQIDLQGATGTRLDTGSAGIDITRPSLGGISLGTNVASTLNISQTEINRMAGNSLTVGHTGASFDDNVTVTAANLSAFAATVLNTRTSVGDVGAANQAQTITFSGANTFAGLTANADDSIAVSSGASITTSGNVIFTAFGNGGNDDIFIDGNVSTNGGDFTANAGDDIRVRAVLSTGQSGGGGVAGDVYLTALGNGLDGLSEVEISGSGRVEAFVGNDGDINIKAQDLILGTGTNRLVAGGDGSPDGTVRIYNAATGTIGLAGGAGTMSISQGELNTIITNNTLVIGDPNAGTSHTTDINVGSGANFTAFGTTQLNALAASSVNFAGPANFGNLDVTTDEINVNSGPITATSIDFNADTVNLNGDLVSGTINGTASTVAVQSNAAQINDAVDVSANNATITVAAGTYAESVVVDKTGLKLHGANFGIEGAGTRGAESRVDPTTSSPAFAVSANNVVIDGFEIGGSTNGITVTNASGAQILNNWLHGLNSGDGILGSNADSLLVSRNKIEMGNDDDGIEVNSSSSGLTVTANTITGGDDGIVIAGSGAFSAQNNFFSGQGSDGIQVDSNSYSSLVVFNNSFSSIGDDAIDNNGNDTVNASGNWWGSSTENTVAGLMEGDIDFTPFLMGGTDTGAAAGFQGDFSSLYVTDQGEQVGSTGRINEAIGLLQDGALTDGDREIRVASGTFSENVLVNKSVTLLGHYAGVNPNTTARTGSLESTISDGFGTNGTAYGFRITAPDVTIDGFSLNTDGNGVHISNASGAVIKNNIIATQNVNDEIDQGIRGVNASAAQILNNRVTVADNDGMNFDGGQNLTISGNTIIRTRNTGSFDGIHLDDIGGTVIVDSNTIDSTTDDGIDVIDVNGIQITNNLIGTTGGASNIGGDGIHVSSSDRAVITGNRVRNTDDDGIDLANSDDVTISGNNVDFVDFNGIEATDSDNLTVAGNDIGTGGSGFVGANAIDVRDADTVLINGNNVIGPWVQGDGIYVDPSFNVTIDGNTITGVGADGIHVDDTVVLTVSNNIVTDAGDDGIELNTVDLAEVLGNVITNSGAAGLFVSGPDNGYVALADNTFTDNPIGAHFESGDLDFTGGTNFINNGDVGLLFAPFPIKRPLGFAPMSLIDDTIGTTTFVGQSNFYIQLANGAFFLPGSPTLLNGLDATYDGLNPAKTGGVLTQAQYDGLEDMIYHYVDDKTLGLFFFGFVPQDDVDQSDIFRKIASFGVGGSGFNITIRGLPSVGGGGGGGNGALSLANISPAAGGDEQDQANATGLADIEPSAGGGDGTQGGASGHDTCWGDAVEAATSGATVTYGSTGLPTDALSDAAGCETGNI